MTIAYVGSLAANMHINTGRIPNDTDIIADYDSLQALHKQLDLVKVYPFSEGNKYYAETRDGHIYESEIAWQGSLSEELLHIIVNDSQSLTDGKGTYWASLNVLYMLKMSHRYLKNSPHFLKTMSDIHLMRKHGAKIRDEHVDFYKRREAATYSYGHPSLNQGKKDFFSNDGLIYTLDHDSIHLAVKNLDRPAYTYFLADEVKVSKTMFESLDRHVQLLSVYEEVCVLAIERSLVPFPNALTPEQAFDMAQMKISTSISSGWWREFAWENFYEVKSMYSDEYFEKFKIGLANGTVKDFV